MKISKHIDKLLKGIVGIVILIFILFKFDSFKSGVSFILNILTPFIIGSIIALYLNVALVHIENLLDRLIYSRLDTDKFKRPLALLISIFLVILVIIFALSIVVPTIRNTFVEFSSSIPTATRDLMAFLNSLDIEIPPDIYSNLTDRLQKLAINIANNLDKILLGSLDIVTTTISTLFNLFLAIVFAIYLLSGKEEISLQVKRILYAALDKEHASVLVLIGENFISIFDRFMVGTIKEATIFVIANSILMKILDLPYIFTVDVIVFFATFIPYFGPLLAGILGSLLVATEGLENGIIFLILYIIMQQIEANVVTPHVVGDEVGLPGIWVMASATIFGALFGIVGMLLAVPFTALIYYLIQDVVDYRLRKKNGEDVKLSEVMLKEGEEIKLSEVFDNHQV